MRILGPILLARRLGCLKNTLSPIEILLVFYQRVISNDKVSIYRYYLALTYAFLIRHPSFWIRLNFFAPSCTRHLKSNPFVIHLCLYFSFGKGVELIIKNSNQQVKGKYFGPEFQFSLLRKQKHANFFPVLSCRHRQKSSWREEPKTFHCFA